MINSKPIHQIEVSNDYSIIIDNTLEVLKEALSFSFQVITISSGEAQKNFSTLHQIIEHLIDAEADRKALFINLGGGVICDMGAFAASIYKRGIHFIQIPTTLLSMVDASVGGKTGINFKAYKNQVGTFSHPELVYIYPNFLKTLTNRHLKNGYAEIIKHQFLMGEALSKQAIENGLNLGDVLIEQIKCSVSYKNKIVEEDFKENGPRKQLNFGHTIGHAIESYFLKNTEREPLLHGEAIAIGFVMEAWLSQQKCNLPAKDLKQIIETTHQIFKPQVIDDSQYEAILNLMMNDKKNKASNIYFALLNALGKPVWDIVVQKNEIIETFNWYKQFTKHAV